VNVLYNYLAVGAVLFILGAVGFLTRRNLILMVLSAEMMLQGVALNLVGFGGYHRNLQGQSFTIFIVTVAACEAALALALILALYRRRRTLDISVWQDLREEGQEPVLDEEPGEPAAAAPAPSFPTLPPAGLEPAPPAPQAAAGEEGRRG
jgi:NADH-quinone oxidoreductase subunit K